MNPKVESDCSLRMRPLALAASHDRRNYDDEILMGLFLFVGGGGNSKCSMGRSWHCPSTPQELPRSWFRVTSNVRSSSAYSLANASAASVRVSSPADMPRRARR